MFCTPPAITTSIVPLITACAAKWTACCDEPHWRSIVTPGTSSGNPAASHAVRAMSPACGPTWSMQPKITSSTVAGVHAGALDDRLQDVRAEVGGMHLRQRPAALADRGSCRVDDVCLSHRSPHTDHGGAVSEQPLIDRQSHLCIRHLSAFRLPA